MPKGDSRTAMFIARFGHFDPNLYMLREIYNALWQALKLNAHNTDNRRTGYYLALDLFRALKADRISKESTRALGKKGSLVVMRIY